MDRFRNYDIAFSGLKTGKHDFKFEINQAFFDLFETEQEFFKPKINVNVLLDKHTTFLEFYIDVSGTVQLICDISNDEFSENIENDLKVLVKFGEEYDDSNEDIITIPQKDSEFNIANLVYETVVLSIPMKKVAPSVRDNDEYEKLLEKYSPKPIEEETEESTDPRWEALKKLKDNN
ncbi:YceD family protein [Epilithonimonas mollis]|uniref:Uncharacterized metal-binding protein YceD, DUF177 family n=1 Tax=Epilithonimonas mollis TaxID=216903 RepID=A0A1M6PJ84_9FLAO|nr:DUF177 domain-containing protein [Epilithonimonas mollis]SHK07987.1 Uncharacterized metal-binding protein YceD, DUF177 family [Epilithonimonas mollis]